jgi:hypothetical protein
MNINIVAILIVITSLCGCSATRNTLATEACDRSLASLVLHQSSLDAIQEEIRNAGYLTYCDEVPSALLNHLMVFPKDADYWKALNHYRSLADGAATECLCFDCFVALVQNPTLFYDRFISGDDEVLVLVKLALAGTSVNMPKYGTWKFSDRQIQLREALLELKKVSRPKEKAGFRHDMFMKTCFVEKVSGK